MPRPLQKARSVPQRKRATGEITITLAEPALGRLEILAEINGTTPAQEIQSAIDAHLERERHHHAAALLTDEELEQRLADFDALGREDSPE